MTAKVLAYRRKHKRCRYCMHCSYQQFSGYYYCNAKNLLMVDADVNVPRWFCKCYEIRGEFE